MYPGLKQVRKNEKVEKYLLEGMKDFDFDLYSDLFEFKGEIRFLDEKTI